MADVHARVVAAARQCRHDLRSLRVGDPEPSRAVLRSMVCAQLVLVSVALGVVHLAPPPPPAVACNGEACASVPVAETASVRLPTRRATSPSGTEPTTASGPESLTPSGGEAHEPSASPSGEPDRHGSRDQDASDPTATTEVVEQEGLRFPPDGTPARALGSRAKQQSPARGMSHERYAEHATELIEALPTLEVLERHLPPSAMTRGVAAQKQHIARLEEEAEITVEGFDAFAVDTSRRDAFVDLPNYHDRIRPELFIVHWTGMGYTDVDHFVTSLKPYRVQYFLDHHAQVFQLFEDDHHKPAHALGANDFSQGVEIETGAFDGVRSPLFSYTTDQIEQTVYLAVEFLRRNELPVDETTLIGHYAADLLFANPHYQPHSGQFVEPSIRKFDPPQELMQVIVAKAQALDAELGPP